MRIFFIDVFITTMKSNPEIQFNLELKIPMCLLKINNHWYKQGDIFTLIYRNGNDIVTQKCKCDKDFEDQLEKIIKTQIETDKQLIGFYKKDLEELKKLYILPDDSNEE